MLPRRSFVVFVVLLVGSSTVFLPMDGWLSLTSADQGDSVPLHVDPDRNLEDFMQVKLGSINDAMSSAATDDFAAVEKAALSLIQLSKQVAWKQRNNATYLQDTADFVSASEYLMRMAGARDTQGVAHAYSAVAVSCLNCHRHMRAPKVAAVSPSGKFSLVGLN